MAGTLTSSGTNPEAISDLVELTLDRYARKSWVDLALSAQEYTIATKWLSGKKTPVKGGLHQAWKIQTANTGTAKFTGLYHSDELETVDHTIGAKQPWSMSTVNFSYDINEPEFQGDDVTTIVDEILVREHAMYNDWFELAEDALWAAPTGSEANRPLSGFPFWLQQNATEGFNGGDPSGHAAGAGNVLGSAVPAWKNYTFKYTGVTRDDLVAKWKKATAFCHFKAPHNFNELGGGVNWEFCTSYALVEPLGQYLDARNDNLKDIAGISNLVFQGVPVRWIPILDDSSATNAYVTNSPIYGINWKTFDFYFLKGRDMVRHAPKQHATRHNVREVHMDAICNMLCKNRRANFVGYI